MGIVLDSNVLSYGTGEQHPHRGACRDLLGAIGDGRIVATTTVEVLQEFAYVRARRRSRVDAAYLAHRYADLLAPLLPVNAADLSIGLGLWQGHQGLGSFDAVLAAAAMRTGATLVSADRAFARVRGLSHVVPDKRGVRRLLEISR